MHYSRNWRHLFTKLSLLFLPPMGCLVYRKSLSAPEETLQFWLVKIITIKYLLSPYMPQKEWRGKYSFYLKLSRITKSRCCLSNSLQINWEVDFVSLTIPTRSWDETFPVNCHCCSTRKFKIPPTPRSLGLPCPSSWVTGLLLLHRQRVHSFSHTPWISTKEQDTKRDRGNSPFCSTRSPCSPGWAERSLAERSLAELPRRAQVVTFHPCPLSGHA